MIVFRLLLLAVSLPGVAMPNQSSSSAVEDAGLPRLADSRSELLSATHVFAFSPLAVETSPWTRGPDQLEHRQMKVRARLLQLFKGKLDAKEGSEFAFTVSQQRESAFVESDYHGLWSDTNLEPRQQYLAIAQGGGTSPAGLLQEPQCRAVLGAPYLADANAALEGERAYRRARGRPAEFPAELAMLGFARERAAGVHDLFARYLWARLEPAFLQAHAILLPAVLALVEADADPLFRGQLAADLYRAVLQLEPDQPLAAAVARAFFAVLRQPGAAPLHAHLVEVELYNLTVREGQAHLPVEAVFPDRSQRGAYQPILARFPSDRARQIASWLGH